MRIRLVAWQMDGTLLNTDRLKMAAHALVVRDLAGRWISFDTYRALFGMPDELCGRLMRQTAGIPDSRYRAYGARFREHYRALMPLVRPVPGAVELLELLRHGPHRIHVVAVSSSDMATMSLMMHASGIDRLVPRRVSGDTLNYRQLPMEPYHQIRHGYGYAGEECVALVSTEHGCRSACEAGMRVVAVRNHLNCRQDLPAARVLTRIDPEEVIGTIGGF